MARALLFIGKRHYTNRDTLKERFGRIYQLPLHWAKAGRHTQLWLLDYHGWCSGRSMRDGLSIRSSPLKTPAVFIALLRYLAFLAGCRGQSVIVASGDCYIGMLGWILARLTRARFVFDVYDKYDEFGGYRRPFGFDSWRFLLESADQRFFASQALMDRFGRPASGDCLVPNGIDLSRFRPMDKLACRRELGLPESEVFVGYFGSMEPDRGVFDLLLAIECLQNQGHSVSLLLGGRCDPALDLDRPWVRYVGNIPFGQVPLFLSSCDVLAIPYRRSDFMDSGASNKIAEALACARPVVATDTPNLTRNFPGQAEVLKARLAVAGDPVDLARVILAQLSQPRLAPMAASFDWESIASRALEAASPKEE